MRTEVDDYAIIAGRWLALALARAGQDIGEAPPRSFHAVRRWAQGLSTTDPVVEGAARRVADLTVPDEAG